MVAHKFACFSLRCRRCSHCVCGERSSLSDRVPLNLCNHSISPPLSKGFNEYLPWYCPCLLKINNFFFYQYTSDIAGIIMRIVMRVCVDDNDPATISLETLLGPSPKVFSIWF